MPVSDGQRRDEVATEPQAPSLDHLLRLQWRDFIDAAATDAEGMQVPGAADRDMWDPLQAAAQLPDWRHRHADQPVYPRDRVRRLARVYRRLAATFADYPMAKLFCLASLPSRPVADGLHGQAELMRLLAYHIRLRDCLSHTDMYGATAALVAFTACRQFAVCPDLTSDPHPEAGAALRQLTRELQGDLSRLHRPDWVVPRLQGHAHAMLWVFAMAAAAASEDAGLDPDKVSYAGLELAQAVTQGDLGRQVVVLYDLLDVLSFPALRSSSPTASPQDIVLHS